VTVDSCALEIVLLTYLLTYLQPVSSVPGRRHLRSARRGELDFPRVNLATYRGRAFAYIRRSHILEPST